MQVIVVQSIDYWFVSRYCRDFGEYFIYKSLDYLNARGLRPVDNYFLVSGVVEKYLWGT